MSDSNRTKNPSIERVEALKAIQPDRYELWKYYEDRADTLGERMWSLGIWLIALINATLSVPFVGGLIKTDPNFPYLKVEMPIAVALLAILGVLFCVYSYVALHDVRDHIESNWRKAGYVLDGSWPAEWGGRKSHGWNVLLIVGVLALVALIGLFLLAFWQKPA